MSSVILNINDIFDEVFNENKRLFSELLFADKLIKILIEFKLFIELVFDKNKYVLDSDDKQKYENFKNLIDDSLKNKNDMKINNSNEELNVKNECNSGFGSNFSDYLSNYKSGDNLNKTKQFLLNFECNECDKRFTSEIRVNKHKNSCHSSQEIADRRLQKAKKSIVSENKRRLLRKHLNRSEVNNEDKTDETPFKCEYDGSDMKLLKQNDHAHPMQDSKDLLKCTINGCHFETRLPRTLRQHKNSHSEDKEKNFICNAIDCDYKTSSEKNLRTHRIRVHDMDCNENETKMAKVKEFFSSCALINQTICEPKPLIMRCSYEGCEKMFPTKRDLKTHVNNVHLLDNSLELLPCPVNGCLFETRDLNSMYNHRKVHSDKKYLCPHPGCDYKSYNSASIDIHVRRLHLSKEEKQKCVKKSQKFYGVYKCSYVGCGKQFINNTKLRDHIQYIHEKDKNVIVKCEYSGCLYETHNPNNLYKHISVCHKEKRYRCDHPGCPFGTDLPYKLKRHQWSHSGEKPFTCDWPGCQYRAISKGNLKSHIVSHVSTEDQHKCPFDGCDKAFKSRHGLENHEKAVHIRSEEYCCEWPGCDFKTFYKEHIKKHRVVHIDDKPFGCHWPGCQFKTKFKDNLKTHMKLHK